MPSQSRSSVQRTHSLPVHTSPQTMLMFQQQGTECSNRPNICFFLIAILLCLNEYVRLACTSSLLSLSLLTCLFTYALYVTGFSSLFLAYFALGQF